MYFSDFTSLFSLVAEKAKEEEKEEEEECFEVLTLKIELNILFFFLCCLFALTQQQYRCVRDFEFVQVDVPA